MKNKIIQVFVWLKRLYHRWDTANMRYLIKRHAPNIWEDVLRNRLKDLQEQEKHKITKIRK